MLLDGRRILVTGVLTESSIAFSVARRAQEEGAEIVLTGFGRGLRITQRIAGGCPSEPDVLELDVNDAAQLAALAAELERRWERLDGLLHAIAFVPADALGGQLPDRAGRVGEDAFRTSAFSLRRWRRRCCRCSSAGDGGGSVVGLDFDARVAWPAYDWAGVPRRRWSRSTATSRATSGRAACAPTSSPPARCRRWPPGTSRASTGWPGRGSARRRWAGT